MSAAKRVLVYGGNGALGRACIAAFRHKQWATIQVDFSSVDGSDNIILNAGQAPTEQQRVVQSEVKKSGLLDAVICCSGGWAGGNVQDADLIKKVESMVQSSLYSSMICASMATAEFLKPNGVLMLPGAAAVDKTAATPGMLPYGVAKAAVHQLLQSLNAEGAGLAKGVTAFGIAPVTLDTPMNRSGMPDADFSTWTPLADLAEQIVSWAGTPPGAGMYLVQTKSGKTSYTML